MIRIISALALCFMMISCGNNRLSKTINQLEYVEIIPPSNLILPGSVVYVRNAKPFTVSIVCEMEQVLGNDFSVDDFIESKTASSQWQNKTNKKFNLETGEIKNINLNLKYNAIKNISLSLTDTKVFEISDSILSSKLKDNKLTENCARDILDRLDSNKSAVTMIYSVLQATVTYSVQWTKDINNELKAKLLEDVASLLTTKYQSDGNSRITGEGLFWGVRDDTFLINKITKHLKFPQSAVSNSNDLQPYRRILAGSKSVFILKDNDK